MCEFTYYRKSFEPFHKGYYLGWNSAIDFIINDTDISSNEEIVEWIKAYRMESKKDEE